MEQNHRSRTVLRRFLSGLVIGAGAVTPGVSGGVIAVTLGLYERTIEAVSTFFKSPKKNFHFLLPLAVGGGLGVLLVSNVVNFLMSQWRVPVLLLFVGVVAGGVPSVLREGNRKGFRPRYLWALAGGAGLLGLFAWLEPLLGLPGGADATVTWAECLICGALLAFGTLIPGVSTSFLLMLFGWYEPFVRALAELHLPVLLPAAAGAVITGLALIKLVHWVFSHVRAYGYYAVTGFTAASALLLLADILGTDFVWWHILFFIAGVAVGSFADRIGNR